MPSQTKVRMRWIQCRTALSRVRPQRQSSPEGQRQCLREGGARRGSLLVISGSVGRCFRAKTRFALTGGCRHEKPLCGPSAPECRLRRNIAVRICRAENAQSVCARRERGQNPPQRLLWGTRFCVAQWNLSGCGGCLLAAAGMITPCIRTRAWQDTLVRCQYDQR